MVMVMMMMIYSHLMTMTSFIDHATYFKNDSTSAVFEGFDSNELEKTREMIKRKSDGRYRSLPEDQDIFDQILTSIQHLLTSKALKQVWHKWDTNINESMNTVVIARDPRMHCIRDANCGTFGLHQAFT